MYLIIFDDLMTKAKCDQRIAALSTKSRKLKKELFMGIWPNHNREENEEASEDQEHSTAPTTL